jgi:hypothetical protein
VVTCPAFFDFKDGQMRSVELMRNLPGKKPFIQLCQHCQHCRRGFRTKTMVSLAIFAYLYTKIMVFSHFARS